MPETRRLPDSMAPCGVYCGACPSFRKGCRGCGSENHKQRRTSKWNCKIRRCCFEEKSLALCSQCTDFPCKLTDKLQEDRKSTRLFRYRHEVYENLREIEAQGLDVWLPGEEERWRCPACGKTIVFYHYQCPACGYEPGRKA